MFILIVAGSQGFDNYQLLAGKLDYLLENRTEVVIRQGECPNSPDTLAKRYAEARGFTLQSFPADWSQGRGAGWKRNWEMARGNRQYPGKANGLAAFTAGTRGTANMIEIAEKCGIPVRIIPVVVDPEKLPKRNKVHTKSGTVKVVSPEIPMHGIVAHGNTLIDINNILTSGKPRPRKGTIIVAGEELIPDTKPKKRGPARSGQTVYKYDYKQIYLDAHKAWFEKEYPSAFRDGHYIPHKLPVVDTANGLATYVLDHLLWTGNYGNRINVMGRQIGGITRTQSGAVFDDRKYIKSSTKKGTSDLQIVIRGISAAVEIKIGSDTQSPDQIKQEARIKKAGGQYMVWKSVDHYLDYYYSVAVQVDLFK